MERVLLIINELFYKNIDIGLNQNLQKLVLLIKSQLNFLLLITSFILASFFFILTAGFSGVKFVMVQEPQDKHVYDISIHLLINDFLLCHNFKNLKVNTLSEFHNCKFLTVCFTYIFKQIIPMSFYCVNSALEHINL